jgi:hypothetical protein
VFSDTWLLEARWYFRCNSLGVTRTFKSIRRYAMKTKTNVKAGNVLWGN